MIINVNEYPYPYAWSKDDAWTILDTETNEYVEVNKILFLLGRYL